MFVCLMFPRISLTTLIQLWILGMCTKGGCWKRKRRRVVRALQFILLLELLPSIEISRSLLPRFDEPLLFTNLLLRLLSCLLRVALLLHCVLFHALTHSGITWIFNVFRSSVSYAEWCVCMYGWWWGWWFWVQSFVRERLRQVDSFFLKLLLFGI